MKINYTGKWNSHGDKLNKYLLDGFLGGEADSTLCQELLHNVFILDISTYLRLTISTNSPLVPMHAYYFGWLCQEDESESNCINSSMVPNLIGLDDGLTVPNQIRNNGFNEVFNKLKKRKRVKSISDFSDQHFKFKTWWFRFEYRWSNDDEKQCRNRRLSNSGDEAIFFTSTILLSRALTKQKQWSGEVTGGLEKHG